MIDFDGLISPLPLVEAAVVDATGKVVIVADGGTGVTPVLDATVLVVVIDEPVAAADVTVCGCGWTTLDDVTGAVVTGPAFDGGVAVVMVEFWFDRQIPVT